MDYETSEKKKHRGWHVIRHEPTSNHEFLSSPFVMKSFEDASCLKFYQMLKELKYHDQLTSTFSTKMQDDKATIAGFQIIMSSQLVSSATWIPYIGENWFKREELDLQSYKMYLKPQYQAYPTYIFPFIHLLDK